jgi:hypothetical protein
MSQLETISDTTGTVAGYKYLGLGRIVVVDGQRGQAHILGKRRIVAES